MYLGLKRGRGVCVKNGRGIEMVKGFEEGGMEGSNRVW